MRRQSRFAAIAFIIVAEAIRTAKAFMLSPRHGHIQNRHHVASLSQTPTDVEALRAAAAKAREDANRLEKQLRKTSTKPQVANASSLNKDELLTKLSTLISEADVSKQIVQWNEYKDKSNVQYFGSADLRTFEVSLSRLEQRTGLTAERLGLIQSEASLDEFKYATLWVTGGATIAAIGSLAFLPENIGATLCYFFALVPVAFLGVGSTAPGVIANAIAVLKGKDGSAQVSNTQDRICRHEAAHLCCGYWCGLPIARSYSTQEGVARVEFEVASTKYSDTEVAALAVTALAGIVGEALTFGNAVGAEQDLLTLEQIMSRSNVRLASSQQNLTRWGALTAALLLRQHEAKYERVVKAFQQQMPIADCIAMLEE